MPNTPFLIRQNSSVLLKALALLFAVAVAGTGTVRAQKASRFEIQRGRDMLATVKADIQKNYYDSSYRGIDLQAVFKEADELIKKADSNGQIFGIIASVLISFNDSHLYFIPPEHAARIEYGWQMQMIGDDCYVVAVRPGSDAEAKGLKEGDRVRLVDEMKPTRADFWKIQYLLNALRPQPELRVVVESPQGALRQLDVAAKVSHGRRITDLGSYEQAMRLVMEEDRDARLRRHRYLELEDKVFVWKMPEFDLPKDKVDEMAGKFKKHETVIIDLRGNGGGYEETLLRLIGWFVPADVKVGDLTRRKESKPLIAKSVGDRAYKGKLVVLTDGESGSSAEIFARVMQLEKRGTVIGDRTAGAVMRAKGYPHETGVDTVAFYMISVTDGDLIMSDGKSLEGTGVVPDELLLPAGGDLAMRRDLPLARALSLAGIQIPADKAAALFPVEWRK